MRTRFRLGAAMAVGLGALLLATVLASPALAWDASVEVKAKCLDNGDVGVKYVVSAWEAGHAADVSASYSVNGGAAVSRPGGELNKDGKFVDHFVLPAGTTGKVVVEATVTWKDSDEEAETPKGKAYLPEKCKGEDSSTTTSESTTTTSESTTTTTSPTTTESSVAPTTSIEETTTTAAVGAATSTTAGGQLPFTGAGSTQPMMLAGIVLVVGGGLFLLLSRRTAR
jgi:LPXTG-motif cell wall-anchored protein